VNVSGQPHDPAVLHPENPLRMGGWVDPSRCGRLVTPSKICSPGRIERSTLEKHSLMVWKGLLWLQKGAIGGLSLAG